MLMGTITLPYSKLFDNVLIFVQVRTFRQWFAASKLLASIWNYHELKIWTYDRISEIFLCLITDILGMSCQLPVASVTAKLASWCLSSFNDIKEIYISWWHHQMETFSVLLAICTGNSPVPVNSPHKGQWRGVLMFSLICAWINGGVNNREAGDLRRYRTHYDVTVMLRYDHRFKFIHETFIGYMYILWVEFD